MELQRVPLLDLDPLDPLVLSRDKQWKDSLMPLILSDIKSVFEQSQLQLHSELLLRYLQVLVLSFCLYFIHHILQ